MHGAEKMHEFATTSTEGSASGTAILPVVSDCARLPKCVVALEECDEPARGEHVEAYTDSPEVRHQLWAVCTQQALQFLQDASSEHI